eukprot:1592882-Amphidinium_carterae.1
MSCPHTSPNLRAIAFVGVFPDGSFVGCGVGRRIQVILFIPSVRSSRINKHNTTKEMPTEKHL